MHRGVRWATVHEVAKTWTQLKQLTCTHALYHKLNSLMYVNPFCDPVICFVYFFFNSKLY